MPRRPVFSPEQLIGELEEAAQGQGISRNEAVVRAVRAWISE